MKQLILFLLFGLTSHSLLGQTTRYWVGPATAAWSSLNWASTSGGAADLLGPPGALDHAVFDGNATANCQLDLAPTISQITIEVGYTGSIICGTNTLTVTGSGNSRFAGGIISGTLGSASLNITVSDTVTFEGTSIQVACAVDAGTLYLNGSSFSRTLDATHNNGVGVVSSAGGNTFEGITSFYQFV